MSNQSLSDYDAQREAGRIATANRVKAFGIFLTVVATELTKLEGKPWKFVPSENDNDVRPYGELVSEGLALSVQQFRDGYGTGAQERISVQGSWPREKHGAYGSLRDYGVIQYGETEPKITVAANGTAVRVAKDIKRRLIDDEDLRGKYEKVLDVIAQRTAYANAKDALAVQLFKVAELPRQQREPHRRDERETLRLYKYAPGLSYGDIEIDGDDSVRINVSVNGEIAKAFIELLKARRS